VEVSPSPAFAAARVAAFSSTEEADNVALRTWFTLPAAFASIGTEVRSIAAANTTERMDFIFLFFIGYSPYIFLKHPAFMLS
jgi:hypothetical protein